MFLQSSNNDIQVEEKLSEQYNSYRQLKVLKAGIAGFFIGVISSLAFPQCKLENQ
jgi:hypothetical protein